MPERQTQFDVVLHSAPTSLDDWKRAEKAAPSQLPSLNKDQKEMARKLGLSEEQYARSFLSLLYGQQRMRDRATKLGRAIEGLLKGVGSGYRLVALTSEFDRDVWIAEIELRERILSVSIQRELADDFLDSGREEYRNKLKQLLIASLRQTG